MYPKSLLRILLSLLILLIGGYLLFTTRKIPASPQICCNDQCFTIELAQTPEERQIWLMYRETLPDDAGMLFVFPDEATHSFRMKNTLIPLDMLRLNTDFQIVDIQETEPCTADPCPSYLPAEKAQYVLELNQGSSKKNGIQIGDKCGLLIDE